jgi:geranylgeranyl diphosphate synthase, type I
MIAEILPLIEEELRRQVSVLDKPQTRPFHEMLTYHLGWSGEGAGPAAQGKRIRPLLLLLATSACGADWKPALPAAAAIELVHNFSLVHDDVQDNSDTRRGRTTLWVKWGMPMGINAGDALFVLADLAMQNLVRDYPPEIVNNAARILSTTCLNLTCGQFLDMSFESRSNLAEEEYWQMISGKTAALLSACCEIGALLGGADRSLQEQYRAFGHSLGLAFQVQDDILGIWGSSAQTGKSSQSDLISRKKSLPVIIGLNKKASFARYWEAGPIDENNVELLAEALTRDGAFLRTQQTADQMMDMALNALKLIDPQGEAGDELFGLVQTLLNRNM